MGRRSSEEIANIEKTIKKIKDETGETSPTKISKILKEQYGQEVSKQTLLNICSKTNVVKEQGGTLGIELEYEDNPDIIKINERIKTLEKDFKNADSVSDRCKLSGQLDSAQESKLKMKKILREAELLQRNSDKTQFIVKFGEPTVIKNDNQKKTIFKTDENQKALPIEKKEGV
jgi:hypothetical protein